MATYDVDSEEVIEEQPEQEIDSSTALMAISRAEIDIQIATAKRYPRSIKKFKQDVYEMACLDPETAESMFYVLPRSGKRIEGPSARLAEIVGAAWGNIRYESDIVAIDDTHITAMGSCMDLEKNAAVRIRVKRRITDRDGNRYNDDMIVVTGNAAASIALRNAIFKIVPFALIKPVYAAAKQLAIGKGTSMVELRTNMLAWYAKKGATQEQVLGLLERRGVDDITMEDLETLAGMRTALKDGESTIDQIFGAVPTKGAKVKAYPLNEKLNGNGNQPKSSTPKPEQPDPSDQREPGDDTGSQYHPDDPRSTMSPLAGLDASLRDCPNNARVNTLLESLLKRHEAGEISAEDWATVQQKGEARKSEIAAARGKAGA